MQPFALKKILLLIAAITCLASTVCFADPVFMNARALPQGGSRSGADLNFNLSDFAATTDALQGNYIGDANVGSSVSLNLELSDGASMPLCGSISQTTSEIEATVELA